MPIVVYSCSFFDFWSYLFFKSLSLGYSDLAYKLIHHLFKYKYKNVSQNLSGIKSYSIKANDEWWNIWNRSF
jgi:hypothetical protein